MGKKKDAVEGEIIEKNGSSKLPLLIFLIGVFLVVTGFMMEIGYIGGGEEAKPTKEADKQNENKEESETTDENTTEVTEVVLVSGESFDLVSSNVYKTSDGKISMNVGEITSTCDATTKVCGTATDVVTLTIIDEQGNSNEITLNVAAPKQTIGVYTFEVKEWKDGVVVFAFTDTSATTDTTTTDTTNNQ